MPPGWPRVDIHNFTDSFAATPTIATPGLPSYPPNCKEGHGMTAASPCGFQRSVRWAIRNAVSQNEDVDML